MKFSTTTTTTADDPHSLTSDFVQECLGFHTTLEQQSKKLEALLQIQGSLQSSRIGGDNTPSSAADDNLNGVEAESSPEQLRRRQEWRTFLEGHSSLDNGGEDEDDGFNDAENNGCDSLENFMLRDSLVKCLVESCSHSPPDNDNVVVNIAGEVQNENITNLDFEVMESSFICLTYLVRLRCNFDDGGGVVRIKRKETSTKSPMIAPIFGHDFVTTIAPHVVEALKLSSSSVRARHVPHAASQFLIALLRSDRPRNEICLPTIRDGILQPATCNAAESQNIGASSSDVDAHIGSVACIAQVLSSSIITAVGTSVPDTGMMDEEEFSMRRETAALNRLQDMRDVVMNVGLVCSRGLLSQNVEDAGMIGQCTDSILRALQEIYDIAAFAVESQLETLLGDEKAMPILAKLSRARSNPGVADKIIGIAAPTKSARGGVDRGGGGGTTMEDYDDDIVEDGREAKLEEACTLAPLYANIPKPPAFLTTYKNLESMLVSIDEKLNATEASLWDERLDALIDLECILAGGVVRMSHEARQLFLEKLRRMPLGDQFQDLRSQITQQVCRVVVATSYEYRDHVSNDPQLNQTMSYFVECLVFPSILNLCKSGTRLMGAQGMNCLLSLSAVCGCIGYPRTVPRYCEEILGDGKVHKNRKRGSVMALTVALRVWKDPVDNGSNSIFVKHLDHLVKATKEAATNRDPAVREEGRKMYWAMHACCNETSRAVETMFHESSREMKNLNKEREHIDGEWEEGVGAMSALVKTGVIGPKSPPKAEAKKSKSSRVPPPSRSSIKRPAGSARFRAQHGTPFKSQKVSTPKKLASSGNEAGVVTAVASTNSKLRPPSKLSTPSALKTGGNASVNHRSSIDVFSSSSKIPRGRPPSNATTAARTQSEEVVAPPRSGLKSRNSSLQRSDGKENSSFSTTAASTPFMKTPTKRSAVGFQLNMASSPGVMTGTPVVNLLARASPLSAEKVRNTGDVLGTIISMLSETHSPHEQSLGIKAMALFAKEERRHYSWEEKFPLVLGCLLDQIKKMPTAVFEEPVDFIRSPSKKNLSSCHQMQHLFLQGVRSLLQFVSMYVKSEQVKDIIRVMLECTKDAPFEIVHTAERALQNLVTGTDPETCFEHLIPFTVVEIDLNNKINPPALLSTLRTMRYLVDRISIDSLKEALPHFAALFRTALCHKSVDMRKATVFILVEMHFVLGAEELELMDDLTDCQRRLVDVYIERHPKNKLHENNADIALESNGLPAQSIISA